MTASTITHIRKWIKARQAELRADHVFLFAASFVGECVLSADTVVTAHGLWFAAGNTTLVYEILNWVIFVVVFKDGLPKSPAKFVAATLGACVGAMAATYTAARLVGV